MLWDEILRLVVIEESLVLTTIRVAVRYNHAYRFLMSIPEGAL